MPRRSAGIVCIRMGVCHRMYTYGGMSLVARAQWEQLNRHAQVHMTIELNCNLVSMAELQLAG